ncbi:thiolase family protein [Saccharopolyspora sp. CA-218241]|uniref:thiolase family protein n=1 Tax=Saccharopolyspora sp. CA-218241 TaxID=3240027 RepID=UPI003D95E9CF
MRDAVIVDAVRTPVGKRGGALSGIHPADLSAHALNALVGRLGLDPADIDDVVWGCVGQVGDQAGNIARTAVLAAGWPTSVPGTSVDRRCGSGQQAVHAAAAGIIAGQHDIVVAGGVESMSRVPMGAANQDGRPMPESVLERFGVGGFNQGVGAELVAERWGLSRRRLDDYSLESHRRAAAAGDSGALDGQLVPVPGALDADEGVRRTTTPDQLAGLRPAFRADGVITAGNSSQISDGTAALLLTTGEIAARRGWSPIARVHTSVLAGADPVIMLTAPLPATRKALRKSGLGLDDIGAYEVNEAFAPVPLAWAAETGAAPDRLNPLGGAIAVGHPLGASGAVLMTRLAHHMRDRGLRYGLQTMCEAGGLANATVLELL